MFWNLFKKEFKYIFKNITFYIFTIVVGLFYFTQFSPPKTTENFKPLSPREIKVQNSSKYMGYGYKDITNPKKEIREMYLKLYRDYEASSTLKVRILLNVNVKLNQKEKQYLKEAMTKIAEDEYLNNEDENLIKVSYKEYSNIMRDIDKKLGGSTFYGDKMRKSFIREPKTYEDAIKDYKELIEKDKLTNAAGRLFSDYMGITAGFFPVFLAAFILMKDKRSKMQELICSRSISSYIYILAKYVALCVALFIPYILVATHATFIFYKIGRFNNYDINMLAFYKFAFWWIAPTLLFTVALGMLISVVFNNGIVAIPIQFILWINSISTLGGDYSLSKFIIRFNRFGGYSNYIKWSRSIAINRLFYIIFSCVLICTTAFIWSKKRGSVGEHIK